MTEPLFWLIFSVLLVVFSLTAVLWAALPAIQELGRAARSAERLLDTLRDHFPATLEALRSTGEELGELTDNLNVGVKHASRIVRQVDRHLHQTQRRTRSLLVGMETAWQRWQQGQKRLPRGRSRRF